MKIHVHMYMYMYMYRRFVFVRFQGRLHVCIGQLAYTCTMYVRLSCMSGRATYMYIHVHVHVPTSELCHVMCHVTIM